MGKCLVTKLNGAVTNDKLLHIGECVIGVESSSADELLFQVNLGNSEYYCEQTHKLGEENVSGGVKKVVNAWKDLKSISAGLYRFHFLGKYNINALLNKNKKGINEINQFTFLNNITQVGLNVNTEFPLDALKPSTGLKMISLKGSVTGDISSLKNLTAITNLSGKFLINGKVEELRMLPKLEVFDCENAVNKGDFGDIALLPVNFRYLNLGRNASISWSSRPSTSKIIGILGLPTLSNIDKMLQDQAQCVTGITSSTPEYMKSITATGTRTSASDTAVQTLQSKGYTVSITPA